jgi:Ca-activated chloride channel homolog
VTRFFRATLVVFGTVLVTLLGLVYPVWMRGEAWRGAKWFAWVGDASPYRVLVGLLFAFLLLAVVPWVVYKMTLGADGREPRLGLPTIAPLLSGPRGWRSRLRDVPGVIRGAALILGVLAIARPQDVLHGENAEERGIDIIIVLDLSGSMRAVMDTAGTPDVETSPEGRSHRATRLDTAKEVIGDFISRRKTDRIGVVVFGKSAFVLSPPTLDYGLLNVLVQKMELDVIDGNGTAIGDAVGTAVARLRRSTARSKAIILLTDGDSNAGSISPEYSAHLAQTQAVKVYTVQIGNGDDVPVQDGVDLFGQPRYVTAHFPVKPDLLQKISGETGGESFIATDKKGLASSMHTILDRLEKTRFEAQAATMEDLFPFLLAPAVVLIALEGLVRVLVIRRFP